MPAAVTKALESSGLEPAVTPGVVDLRDEGEGVEVDLKVTLWPTVDDLPEYDGREIEVESPEADDEELAENVDRMREQFADSGETMDMYDEGGYGAGDAPVGGVAVKGEPVALEGEKRVGLGAQDAAMLDEDKPVGLLPPMSKQG